MEIFKKLKSFISRNGIIFGCFRGTIRISLKALNYLNTLRWKFILGSLGTGSVIELGVKIENPKQVYVGNYSILRKGSLLISELGTGCLKIGDHVQINEGVKIDHTGGLNIDNLVLVSEEAIIYSHSHGLDPRSKPVGMRKSIEENVWIGARAIILESCQHIGSNSIVGAGSVVTKAVSENVLVSGMKASVVKTVKR
jgi:acetyltransferase-like isoleucine patch superfamily enzyme